jgi:hypothetical protein
LGSREKELTLTYERRKRSRRRERCHRWKRLNEEEDGLFAGNGSGSPVGFTAD